MFVDVVGGDEGDVDAVGDDEVCIYFAQLRQLQEVVLVDVIENRAPGRHCHRMGHSFHPTVR